MNAKLSNTHHDCPMCRGCGRVNPDRVRTLETTVKWFPRKLTKIGVWERFNLKPFIMEFFDCGWSKVLWWMDDSLGDVRRKKNVTIFSRLDE